MVVATPVEAQAGSTQLAWAPRCTPPRINHDVEHRKYSLKTRMQAAVMRRAAIRWLSA